MNTSLAAIEPPGSNFGETQTTRPTTSDTTVAFSFSTTEPVRRSVSACSVGVG